MTEKPSREERLAAKLRENLHRRKAQAREIRGGEATGASAGPEAERAGENPAAGVPKTPPES